MHIEYAPEAGIVAVCCLSENSLFAGAGHITMLHSRHCCILTHDYKAVRFAFTTLGFFHHGEM